MSASKSICLFLCLCLSVFAESGAYARIIIRIPNKRSDGKEMENDDGADGAGEQEKIIY